MTKDLYGYGFAWICPFCEKVIDAMNEKELVAKKLAHLPCSGQKKKRDTNE